jgi:predicted acylesterase/phospholipase RssA
MATNTTRICGLVMKGGITSGVVYPLAVCELAKTYAFKNIGGTSAGAIAAAAAAAAEYGRRTGSKDATAFNGLAALPDWIGAPGRLLKMFQPSPSTRALFNLLMAAVNPKTLSGKFFAIVWQLIRNFPLTVVLLVAVVWAIHRWLLSDLTGVIYIYAAVLTVIVSLVAFLIVVVLFLARQVTRTLPENFYGMARGYDETIGDNASDAPLINWLTRFLNELAGKPLANGPLTFGDLYGAPRADGDPEEDGPGYRSINLEMMTTALNHGRPYRVPFQPPDTLFFFCPDEMRRLFPPRVVQHMIDHAAPVDGLLPEAKGCGRLYRMPDAADLPVVVATRMSLSFPVLLSAVPLYAVDFGLKANQDRSKAPTAERCWFSDGGISSNLPIHFFDGPLPLWPTFAINLKQFHPDFQAEADAVFLPNNVSGGMQVAWTRFEQAGQFGFVTDFLWTIIGTMQNWQDSTQSRVPGYRDRLVHVSQRKDEGGLNLNMPAATVARLADRGRRAGEKLVTRFGTNPEAADSGWTEHRWVRFRSCMELTAKWIGGLAESYQHAIPPDPGFDAVLTRSKGSAPTAYPQGTSDQQRSKTAMDLLMAMWAQWKKSGTGFDDGHAPRPTPSLRIRAKV